MNDLWLALIFSAPLAIPLMVLYVDLLRLADAIYGTGYASIIHRPHQITTTRTHASDMVDAFAYSMAVHKALHKGDSK